MDGTQILALGLGLEAPWILKNQHLDTAVSPHRLDLYVEAERFCVYRNNRLAGGTSSA